MTDLAITVLGLALSLTLFSAAITGGFSAR